MQDFAQASQGAHNADSLHRGLPRAGVPLFLLQGAAGPAWLADLPLGWAAATPTNDAVLVTAAQSYAPFLWSDISG